MAGFLETDGPREQLVRLGNIAIVRREDGVELRLNDRIGVRPIVAPHRDEYSETVGFRVQGPKRSMLIIPDVDKWDTLATAVETLIHDVDVANLDGTFFDSGELPN